MYVKTFPEAEWVVAIDGRRELEDNSQILPNSVRKWAGLRSRIPEVQTPKSEGFGKPIHITELNDDFEWDFNMLAEIIERDL